MFGILALTFGCGHVKPDSTESDSNNVPSFTKVSGTKDEYAGNADTITIVENEKNGIAQELSIRLASLLSGQPRVDAAYLVRVKYDEKELGVACAIESPDDKLDPTLKRKIFDVFMKLKGTRKISLDCFLVYPEIKKQLEARAKPFYVKSKI